MTDKVVEEYPLTIYINHEEFATLVCTPAHLEELVIGFLASEGIITQVKEIARLHFDFPKGLAHVELKRPFRPEFFRPRRITSCCGNSRQSFYYYSDARTAKAATGMLRIESASCIRLIEQLQSRSQLHTETGGVHNAALCTSDSILLSFADIGRHNALDKIYGYLLKHELAIDDKILAFSGRISSEILLKAAKIGCSVILSKSAPTALALAMADELGITVVGFIRNGMMNVYTHPERIANPVKK
jgi:FdhD protein